MSKRGSLSAALEEVSGRTNPLTPKAAPELKPAQAARSPGRRGKRLISGYFDPAASKQLKRLALDADSNVQALLTEALNDLFEKHGLSRIA